MVKTAAILNMMVKTAAILNIGAPHNHSETDRLTEELKTQIELRFSLNLDYWVPAILNFKVKTRPYDWYGVRFGILIVELYEKVPSYVFQGHLDQK